MIIKRLLAGSILVSSAMCWGQENSIVFVLGDEDPVHLQMLADGNGLIHAGRPESAIAEYFDKLISEFEASYENAERQIYCARSMEESLVYTAAATTDGRNVEVLSNTWADVHFLKGYALVELGRLPEARSSLEHAVALSPMNAQYLSELGQIYSYEQNWSKALEYFETAEKAAEWSPSEVQTAELGRAKRGVGYVLVELGRLDEAEEKYLQSLEIDPNDKSAKGELEYVRGLKATR